MLHASTIPSYKTIKLHISMASSFTESTHFSSSSQEMLASPDSVAIFKTDVCIKKYTLKTNILKALREKNMQI